MSDAPAQLVHGLRLRGDVPIHGAPPVTDGGVDYEVRLEEPASTSQAPPEGELVAALGWPGSGYAAALRDRMLTIRFFDSGEFAVALDGGSIAARPAPGRGEAMVPVLLAGNVL